jgi:hypothetical protein
MLTHQDPYLRKESALAVTKLLKIHTSAHDKVLVLDWSALIDLLIAGVCICIACSLNSPPRFLVGLPVHHGAASDAAE